MRIRLTEAERLVVPTRYSLGESQTRAWRAFLKAIGAPITDPIMVIDGDGDQFEPITRRSFYLEQADGGRFLSLGYCGCWDGGAMRSLSPSITYISCSVTPAGRFVDFHGWHRPKEKSRIISPALAGPAPYLTKDGLAPMGILVGILKRQIARAGQVTG